MKRTIPALLFAGLILAAMASCKKEDDSKPSNNTTTSTTTGSTNPLIKKACSGSGDITIDGQKDTLHAMEAILPPVNIYGIYTMGEDIDLSLQSGAKSLPAVNTVFQVAGDPDKMPAANEMILSHYDSEKELDYYAQSGTVTYTISATAKTVKFTNLQFKAASGEVKTISFEAKLK
jgi:hypothetical protein